MMRCVAVFCHREVISMAETVTIKDGKLISSQVVDKISSKIEKGALAKVNAIIVHQTG